MEPRKEVESDAREEAKKIIDFVEKTAKSVGGKIQTPQTVTALKQILAAVGELVKKYDQESEPRYIKKAVCLLQEVNFIEKAEKSFLGFFNEPTPGTLKELLKSQSTAIILKAGPALLEEVQREYKALLDYPLPKQSEKRGYCESVVGSLHTSLTQLDQLNSHIYFYPTKNGEVLMTEAMGKWQNDMMERAQGNKTSADEAMRDFARGFTIMGEDHRGDLHEKEEAIRAALGALVDKSKPKDEKHRALLLAWLLKNGGQVNDSLLAGILVNDLKIRVPEVMRLPNKHGWSINNEGRICINLELNLSALNLSCMLEKEREERGLSTLTKEQKESMAVCFAKDNNVSYLSLIQWSKRDHPSLKPLVTLTASVELDVVEVKDQLQVVPKIKYVQYQPFVDFPMIPSMREMKKMNDELFGEQVSEKGNAPQGEGKINRGF